MIFVFSGFFNCIRWHFVTVDVNAGLVGVSEGRVFYRVATVLHKPTCVRDTRTSWCS